MVYLWVGWYCYLVERRKDYVRNENEIKTGSIYYKIY